LLTFSKQIATFAKHSRSAWGMGKQASGFCIAIQFYVSFLK